MNEWYVRPLCAAPVAGVHVRVARHVGVGMSNFVHAGEQPTDGRGWSGVPGSQSQCLLADSMAFGRVRFSIV